jgi:hypothetical protein
MTCRGGTPSAAAAASASTLGAPVDRRRGLRRVWGLGLWASLPAMAGAGDPQALAYDPVWLRLGHYESRGRKTGQGDKW